MTHYDEDELNDIPEEDKSKPGKPDLIMRQVMPARWQIESANGYVMKSDINVGSVAEALEYVRKYASSFSWWTYKVISLKDIEKKH